MKLRVLQVIEEAKVGGPQKRTIAIAHALGNRVESVIIMPEENSEQLKSMCELKKIPYRSLDLTRITKEKSVAFRYVLFFPLEVYKLYRFFKRDTANIVHVGGGSWQIKGVIAGKMARKKVIWHLNDTCMPKFIHYVFAIVSRLADGFIYASERSRDYYGPMLAANRREFLIPSPVDCDSFDPKLDYSGEKDLIDSWAGKIVIGTLSNVSPVKGLEVLIKCAATLVSQGFDVMFVVVGAIHTSQQRYYRELTVLVESLSLDCIQFVNSRSDVRPLLKRFDIYLCCSNAESSPLAVWEAMAMSKPIVSTDVGDVPLYVEKKNCGFIVDVGDFMAMAQKLVRLIEDKDLRKRFSKKSREVAIRNLDLGHCADRHFHAYEELTSI